MLTDDWLKPLLGFQTVDGCAPEWPAFVVGIFAGIGLICSGIAIWHGAQYVRDLIADIYPQRRQTPDQGGRHG